MIVMKQSYQIFALKMIFEGCIDMVASLTPHIQHEKSKFLKKYLLQSKQITYCVYI